MKEKKKNIVIVVAMIAVLAIGSIAAYFTATDSVTNTFVVGNVEIDLREDQYDSHKADDLDNDGIADVNEITPNKEIIKDPSVKNTGENDAYVFTMVAIPKKSVKVAATDTHGLIEAGTVENNGAAQMTQLYQMNKTNDGIGSLGENAIVNTLSGTSDTYSGTGLQLPVVSPNASNDSRSWTGIDTFNDNAWYLIDVNPNTSVLSAYESNYNIYLFAYGNKDGLTKLAGKRGSSSGAQTPALFSSVTFANVVNINDINNTNGRDGVNLGYDSGLEGTVPEIYIQSFAIQTENITSENSTMPASVWSILNNQDGAYANFATGLADLSNDWAPNNQ